jgi:hypothetical protein
MGADENQSYSNAVAALGEWAHDARSEGATPMPRTIEVLRSDRDVRAALAEGTIFLAVPLVIEAARPVKANISLDQGLLDAIDATARRSGLTRSGFLASAARKDRSRRLTCVQVSSAQSSLRRAEPSN